MRLTCPSCSAQYEVDEKVIPKVGRDVQCSACGNTWYQYPQEVALQMRTAELEDDDDLDDESDSDDSGDGDFRALGIQGAGASMRPTMPERGAPRIDKTVLDVLREEAERELGERKRAQSGLETQGDLGLTRPTRSKAAPSRIYGEDDPALAIQPADIPQEPEETEVPVSRRKLLPDIEELSSTLEPGSERRDSGGDNDDEGDPRGFRRGLSLVMLIALALIMLYLLAPMLGNTVPALNGPLTAYVGLVDGLRLGFAGAIRSLLGG